MTIAPELHQQLLTRAAANLEVHADCLALASKYSLLPVYLDMGGFIGIRADAELLSVSWEPPQELEVVVEPNWRRLALAAAEERYPELRSLRPIRPADAIVCSMCGGSGGAQLRGRDVPDGVRCFCGGLGWILPSEAPRA